MVYIFFSNKSKVVYNRIDQIQILVFTYSHHDSILTLNIVFDHHDIVCSCIIFGSYFLTAVLTFLFFCFVKCVTCRLSEMLQCNFNILNLKCIRYHCLQLINRFLKKLFSLLYLSISGERSILLFLFCFLMLCYCNNNHYYCCQCFTYIFLMP